MNLELKPDVLARRKQMTKFFLLGLEIFFRVRTGNHFARHPLDNFDANALELAPTLRKLEPYLEGYDLESMVTLPPSFSSEPVVWNWKMLLENYIEPYHREYVHPIIHDFAPSTGVEFDPWRGDDDNADFHVAGTILALRASFVGDGDPERYEVNGELEISADRGAFARFRSCFPVPVTA